ncbi:hypothetical protein PR001_g30339, partial [Phytophthora rubi]
MNAVLPPKQDGVYYAVVTDRFYTSIQSALQLLERNVYSVGTIQTNKKGFPPALVQEKSKRPKDIPRGTTKIVVAKSAPQMSAMVWFDNTIVYMLGCGTSTSMSTCGPATPTCDDASSTSGRHRLEMDDEWVEVNGIRKRRQRQCKVCTIRKTVRSKRQMTRFYCAKCSKGSKRVCLCDKVRQGQYPNNNMTCYDIWHQLWRNGTEGPQPRCGRGIQMRAPGKKSTDADEEADDDQDTTGGANSNAPDGATGGGALEENRDNGSNEGAANEEEGGAGNREEDGTG